MNNNLDKAKRKIGMILDGAYPPDPRVENEAVMLITYGYEVHLFSLDFEGCKAEFEIYKGINVHRYKVGKLIYKLSALAYTLPFYHLQLVRAISNFIGKNKIELLHVHDMQLARAVFWANKRFRLPITLDLHENRPEIMKFYTHVKSITGRLTIFPSRWKKFEYTYIRKANRVIVVTEEAKDYYLNEINVDENKFCVVPNTVRKEFYTNFYTDKDILTKYKDSFNILYLGDTGIRRGIISMIEAAAILKGEIPNIKMLIVGKSKSDPIYHKMIAEGGLENHVEMLGWKDQSLFQSYILASHIGACPLHKNLHHETTYANKIFMYLAFGKPLVVSDCKAQANIARDYKCGLVSKDRDSKDFAKQVLRLFRDKELYKSYSSNGKKAILEELNWDMKSKELIHLYEAYDRKRV